MPYAIEGIINLENSGSHCMRTTNTTILMHEAVAIDPADKNVRATNLKPRDPVDSL